MLSKLPKLVLLTKLLPFLDEDELNKVASICKVLRKLVYSPMGLKIIVYNRTRRMAEYFRDNVMAKASYNVIHDHPASYGQGGPLAGLSKRDLERAQGVVDSLKEDQAEEIQSLRNVKKFLTEKLDRSKVTLELMQKEIVELKNELRYSIEFYGTKTIKLSRISQDRDRYYEALVRIKNSFYQTSVLQQIQQDSGSQANDESRSGD